MITFYQRNLRQPKSESCLNTALVTKNLQVDHECFDLLVNVKVVATIKHEIRHFFEMGEVNIVSGKVVIELTSHKCLTDLADATDFNYTAFNRATELWQLRISDFIISRPLSGLDVGRFVWHLIYHAMPTTIRSRVCVHGGLSPHDASKRRDALWMDVCGKSANRSDALYESSALRFSGPITDPWLAGIARFKPEPTRASSLSTSAQQSMLFA